jgi:hypothetical protein
VTHHSTGVYGDRTMARYVSNLAGSMIQLHSMRVAFSGSAISLFMRMLIIEVSKLCRFLSSILCQRFYSALHPDFELPSYVDNTGSAARNRMYAGSFGRVGLGGTFQTIVTVVNPSNRQGRCLHPTVRVVAVNAHYPCLPFKHGQQMRVLTVRECARAQGFGDSTDFISVQNSQEDVSDLRSMIVSLPAR